MAPYARAIATSIHDEKCDISEAEIEVMVIAIVRRFIISIRVVDFESIGCIREWRGRIISSASKIVDNLLISGQ
jgi:hypothetical protein